MGATVIRVNDVSKQFSIRQDTSLKERLVNARRIKQHTESFYALKNVSFDVESSTTLGLIGHNGSGKSTLLKVIGGILTPDTGYVERRGRLAALLEVGAGFHGDLTGRENVYLNASILGLTRRQTEAYFDDIIAFADIGDRFIDTQVKFYSSGMYVRLAFAVAVHVDPEILLIDEVLAVGDEPFQRKCMERIKSFQREGRTIVFVTHGLDSVRQLCDRAILLDHGDVVVDGTPIEAVRTFRERYTAEPVHDDDYGDGRLKILGTSITDGEGATKERFEPGDTLGIEMQVEAHGKVEEWVAGIAIEDHLDNVVYGTNTELQGLTLPPVKDTVTVRFRFADIPMVEGQYYVSVAVHAPGSSSIFHRLDRRSSFRVFTDGTEEGVLHLTPKIEVLET